jgi:hypothetical protein
MALNCPSGCQEDQEHHTKTELAKRVNSENRGKLHHLSGQNAPPYIEIEEEEDNQSFNFEGQEELGLLVTALEGLGRLTKDQKALKALAAAQPRQLAIDLKEMIISAGADTKARKKSYLAEVAKKPSKKLFEAQDQAKALDTAKELLDNSPEDLLDKPQSYTPAHTPNRLEDFMEATGKKVTVTPYLEALATAKKLNEDHFEVSVAVEDFIDEVFKSRSIKADTFEKQFEVTANPETFLPMVAPIGDGWSNAIGLLPDELVKSLLQSPSELQAYNLREEKLAALKMSWLELNPKPAINQFERSAEKGRFLIENPLPIAQAEISQRFLNFLNNPIARIAREARRKSKGLELATYKDFLESSFSFKSDLLEVAYWIPERPEGHSSHLKALEKQYRRLRTKLTHQEIIKCLTVNGNITSKPEASQYALSPDKFLADKCQSKFQSKLASNLEPLKAK